MKGSIPKISFEDWVADINTLPKDVMYLIISTNTISISYHGGYFIISTHNGVSRRKYEFNSLCRAYAYFEELLYKDN